MRYKKGTKKDTLQKSQAFRDFAGGILSSKREETQNILGLEEIRHYISFFNKDGGMALTSLLTMPLHKPYGPDPQEVLNRRGECVGVFDFKHVELCVGSGDSRNVFYFK